MEPHFVFLPGVHPWLGSCNGVDDEWMVQKMVKESGASVVKGGFEWKRE